MTLRGFSPSEEVLISFLTLLVATVRSSLGILQEPNQILAELADMLLVH